jgi:hypothetical protein
VRALDWIGVDKSQYIVAIQMLCSPTTARRQMNTTVSSQLNEYEDSTLEFAYRSDLTYIQQIKDNTSEFKLMLRSFIISMEISETLLNRLFRKLCFNK